MAVKIGDNQALYRESALIGAFPFTLACWFRASTITKRHPLIWMGDKDVSNANMVDLMTWGTTEGDPVWVRAIDAGGAYRKAATATYQAETWHHVVGTYVSASDMSAYLDGVVGDENVQCRNLTFGNWDRVALGALLDSTPYYADWQELAEAAVWSRALEAWKIALLALGYSPLFFLEDLVAYWPLGGLFGNNYRGIIGGYDLSEWGGSLEWTNHPPVIYSKKPRIARPIWEPLSYSVTRSQYITTVTVTSDRPDTEYYHWYVDGAYVASTTSPTRSFRLSEGDQVRIEVRATNDPDYDPVSDPPIGWPARRSLWWVRSIDADVDYYRVEQKLGAGDWETLRIVNQVDDQWTYWLLTDRLDDLASYTWRVIPIDAAGNDGTAVVIGAELIVRSPDAPEFTATFDPGTTKVTFEEA